MPLPVRYNPSYSTSSGLPRRSILSATPQQKLSSNYNAMSCNSKANYNAMSCNSKFSYNAMSCNSKFAMSSNSKFMPASERKHLPDTRPLSDGAYHQECFAQILNFCSKNNYPLKRDQLNFMSPGEIEKLFSVSIIAFSKPLRSGSIEMLTHRSLPFSSSSSYRSMRSRSSKAHRRSRYRRCW